MACRLALSLINFPIQPVAESPRVVVNLWLANTVSDGDLCLLESIFLRKPMGQHSGQNVAADLKNGVAGAGDLRNSVPKLNV